MPKISHNSYTLSRWREPERGAFSQLGRWHCPDAFGEMYASTSPYAYCGNDPVNMVDPSGLNNVRISPSVMDMIQVVWDATPDDGVGHWSASGGLSVYSSLGTAQSAGISFPKIGHGGGGNGKSSSSGYYTLKIQSKSSGFLRWETLKSTTYSFWDKVHHFFGLKIVPKWNEGEMQPSTFYMDNYGYIHSMHINESSQNAQLYSYNFKNGELGNYIDISDKKILYELMLYTINTRVSKVSRTSKSADELYKLFKFLSDNTIVEWRIDQIKNGIYTLGTKHNKDFSPSSVMLGHTDNDIIDLLHSHPEINLNTELSSMGLSGNSIIGPSDMTNVRDFKNKNGYFYSYRTYFPNSGNIYLVQYSNILLLKGGTLKK